MGSHSIKGVWWLPGHEHEKVPGELIRTERGTLELDLGSSVSATQLPFHTTAEHPPRLLFHGVDENGSPVTLVDCVGGLVHSSPLGYARDAFGVAYGLIGIHAANSEELLFECATFGFTHLIDWLYRPAIIMDLSHENPHRVFRLQFPEELRFPLEHGELMISSEFSTEHDRYRSLHVAHKPYVKVTHEPKMGAPEWLNNLVQPLRDFLTLATSHRNDLAWMKVRTANHLDFTGHPADIEVLLPRDFSRGYHLDNIYPHDQLFCWHDIQARSHGLFRTWLRLYSELDNVISLYFHPMYNDRMYPQHEFLDLAQGLETYHRRRMPDGRWSPEEYGRLREKMLAPLEGQEREWAERQLEHANEPPFRSRIKALLSKCSEPMQMFAFDRKAFVQKVTNTRNYYVHWNESLKSKAATGESLFRMSQILRCLLEACILLELEFPSELISELFKRNQTNCYTSSVLKDQPELVQ